VRPAERNHFEQKGNKENPPIMEWWETLLKVKGLGLTTLVLSVE